MIICNKSVREITNWASLENTKNGFSLVKLSTVVKPYGLYICKYVGNCFETFLNTYKKVVHDTISEDTLGTSMNTQNTTAKPYSNTLKMKQLRT